jgi:hypothetical protein
VLILISVLKYWPGLFEHLFINSMDKADQLLHLAR